MVSNIYFTILIILYFSKIQIHINAENINTLGQFSDFLANINKFVAPQAHSTLLGELLAM